MKIYYEIDFLLCYEHWQRELIGLCLLKVKLESRGYKVKLFNIHSNEVDHLEYYIYKPKVVIFPWVYGDRELQKANRFIGKSTIVVNMQCEQLLSNRVIKSGFFSIKGSARNAYHVSWGDISTSRFINDKVNKQNILELGNINLEVNNVRYDKLFYNREEIASLYHLDINKKWILFASNFKFTNTELSKLAEYERRTSNIFGLTSEMIRNKRVIVSWLEKLLKENSDIEVIYRPHPIEISDIYLKYLNEKYDNFHYNGELSINQWSRVIDRCLTWNSTAILDAITSNVAAAMVMPYDLPYIFKGDLDDISYVIATFEDLYNFIYNDSKEIIEYNKIKLKSKILLNENIVDDFIHELTRILNEGKPIITGEQSDFLPKKTLPYWITLLTKYRKRRHKVKKIETEIIKKVRMIL